MQQHPQVDLVGVGLNATDTVIPLATFPACGSKLEYHLRDRHARRPGRLHRRRLPDLGLRTRYVGKLGDDSAARLHRNEFARLGVDAQCIEVPHTASAKSLILVNHDGERTVLCRKDSRLNLRPEELKRDWITTARALHVDGYDTAAATTAARWAREAGIPVIADLDEIYDGVEQLLENIDYLIVSKDFPGRLMADKDPERALRNMQLRYGARLTATTLGPDGVLAWDGNQLHHRSAYRVPVIDTTGAGDIFHAGFIYGLLQDWPLARQLDFACAAAMNCTAQGARGSIQSVDVIESLMATTPATTPPTQTRSWQTRS